MNQEQACMQALFLAKWPDGFRCPRCQHGQYYRISTRRLPLYECKSCRCQTSLIAGTIMEGSRTPLASWFKAIELHCLPEGINALQLSTVIRVTYKTAWLICHKIRHAMSRAESSLLLTGMVKVSNALLYQNSVSRLKWGPKEQSVLIAASKDPNGALQIKMEKQNKDQLRHKYALPDARPFIRRVVAPQAVRFVRVCGFLSVNRRQSLIRIVREAGRQLAVQFRGIGPKYLQVYLNQICYSRNWQSDSSFRTLLCHCAQAPRITYPLLTGRISSPVLRRVERNRDRNKIAV